MKYLVKVFCIFVFLILSGSILVNAEIISSMSYNDYNMNPGVSYYSPELQQGSDTTARGYFVNNGAVDGNGDMVVYHKVTGSDIVVCEATSGNMPAGTGHKECTDPNNASGDTNVTEAWYNSTENNGYITSRIAIE